MDRRLLAWARAVKARQVRAGLPRVAVLWLFTDTARLADPLAAIGRLPAGLCGVVLRDDGRPDRARLGRRIAHVCRQRRLALAVAGDWRLAAALRAGLHLRGGARPATAPRFLRALTASAHGRAEVCRARRAGAGLIFASPVFTTASHPLATGLGPLRWARMTRGTGGAAALGGIDGATIRRLPSRLCRAVAGIGFVRTRE